MDLNERYQDAQYRAMAEAYAAAHKHDAEKEPEPETDLQQVARWMQAPAHGAAAANTKRLDNDAKLSRMITEAQETRTDHCI